MHIEFISNAAVIVRLMDGRQILVDPWLDGGIYYGSWYNFPPVTTEAAARYRSLKPSYIYISHVHPDHLDPGTLASYPPTTPVLIGKFKRDHLLRALRRVGFESIIELPLDEPQDIDGLKLTIFSQFRGTSAGFTDDVDYEIDTSLLVKDRDGQKFFHAIDNPIKPLDAARIATKFGPIDAAILPYSGASMFPHAFSNYTEQEKAAARDRLKQACLQRFCEIAQNIKARAVVPAAGSYVMGGRIADYSKYLHQASPAEIRAAWTADGPNQSRLAILATGDRLDTQSGEIARISGVPDFTAEDRLRYAQTLGDKPLAQDLVFVPPAFEIPWLRLLHKARANQWRTQHELKIFPRVDVCLELRPCENIGRPQEPIIFRFPLDAGAEVQQSSTGTGRAMITFRIDAALMLMVLLGAAIWNNVEIGALVECERVPNVYDPTIHSLMSHFIL